ncbi:hypothetical protein [Herbiconiux solani]|uniref:hypothetical protein n=1 Tax=Herbiconiux solani TaxID=661329 RepID=UPI0012EDA220|nr:hypothetical protein [Herbiconiux solani]
MSTDLVSTDLAGGRDPASVTRRLRRFNRLLYGSIGVIALVAGGLTAASLGQGPRLVGGQLNVQAAVERAGQRLLLETDGAVAALPDASVVVTPAAAASATSDGSTITVTFTTPLQYDTDYSVRISDVTAEQTGASSTVEYTFHTPDPLVHFLRSTPQGDQIVSSRTAGGDVDVLAEAPSIRRFAVVGDTIAVVQTDESGDDSLSVIRAGAATPVTIDLGGPGTVDSLRASPGSNLFGYTFTARSTGYSAPIPPRQLFAYDLTRGQDYPIPVTGPDFEQFTAADWSFVPGSTSVLARTDDGDLYLADVVGERDATSSAVEMGHAEAFGGFVRGTTDAVLTEDGRSVVRGVDAASSSLGSPSTSTSTSTSTGAVAGAESGPVSSLAVVLDPSGTRLVVDDGVLERVTAQGGRETLLDATPGDQVTALCLAPNGRSAVLASIDARGDGMLEYVDLDDPSTVSRMPGREPDWCGRD